MTLRPIYSTSLMIVEGQYASHTDRFIQTAHWTLEWVGFRTNLDSSEENHNYLYQSSNRGRSSDSHSL
jgi:hypothetical protein